MDDKIILFPKMRVKLEQEVEKEIQQENYTSAIEKLETLRNHGQVSYSIHIQSLVCYIRLKRFTEAELLCEELLDKQDEHYMDYLDYYIIILFEAKKYQAVIERINEETESNELPEKLFSKFQEMKLLAAQMNEWQASEIVGDIKQAIQDSNSKKQYYLLQKWLPLNLQSPALFYDLLKEDSIHPVIKTMIFIKLRNEGVSEEVTIRKFDQEMKIIPKWLGYIEENPVYQGTIEKLQHVEQDNPTLYGLMKEVYDQYRYVMYPFMHTEAEIDLIVEAIDQIVQIQFEDDQDVEKSSIMKQIQFCCHLYQDIMLQ